MLEEEMRQVDYYQNLIERQQFMVYITLLFLAFGVSVAQLLNLDRLSCLYIDRISLWSPSGSPISSIPGGYDFSIAFRETLPNIISAGVTMYEFLIDTPPQVMVGYSVQLTGINNSSANLNFNPNGPNSNLTYISFTIIVNTEDVSYLLLMSTDRTNPNPDYHSNISPSDSWSVPITKFVFPDPNIECFLLFQSVTFSRIFSTSNITFNTGCSKITSTNSIRISYFSSESVYLYIGYTVILISRLTTQLNIGKYYYTYLQSNGPFVSNFGIPTDYFGNMNDYMCIYSTMKDFGYLWTRNSLELVLNINTLSFNTTSLSTNNWGKIQVGVLCLGEVHNSTYYILERVVTQNASYAYSSCDSAMANCETCTSDSNCLSCKNSSSYLLANNSGCLLCQITYPHCQICNSSICITCLAPYTFDSLNQCFLNCSVLCLSCVISDQDPSRAECGSCLSGFYPIDETLDCSSRCGDGIVVGGQQCDDGNADDGDGCSSRCEVEQYFSCSNGTNTSSVCLIKEINMEVIGIVKDSQLNEFTLTIELKPFGMKIYSQSLWDTCFDGATPSGTAYDPSSGRLRVTLPYGEEVNSQNLQINASCQHVSSLVANVSTVFLSIPQEALNNLAFQYYPDTTYAISKMVRFVSMGVAAITLLLFVAGYFGGKLIALECIAVIQLSALLLLTQKNMGPSFDGLKYLKFSLGIFPIDAIPYFHQYSDLPVHTRTIYSSRGNINSFNIALLSIMGPLIVGLILKIMSKIKENNDSYVKAWKTALGSITYYGLLFLAYGEFSSLGLNIVNFQSSVQGGVSIGIGIIFAMIYVGYVIASNKYPRYFGPFKSKFYRYESPQYFYNASSLERFVNSLIVTCLSPGAVAAGVPCVLLLGEALFIVIKQPYHEGAWRRPLVLKVLAMTICLLFVVSALTSTQGLVNQLIPVVILLLLLVAIVMSTAILTIQLYQYCKSLSQASSKSIAPPPLSVEQSNRLIFQQFQRKLIPSMETPKLNSWGNVEHETEDIKNWRWNNYTKLYSLNLISHIRNKIPAVKQQKEEGIEEMQGSDGDGEKRPEGVGKSL